jgi:hypothetical protein
MVQASSTRLRVVSSCARAKACSACWSSFHSRISNWPLRTWSPSFTASTSMRPPAMVDRRVRWQASTVPARVLATVASTVPRATVVVSTGTGFGRPAHQASVPTKASIPSAMRLRRIQGRVVLAGMRFPARGDVHTA